MFHCGNIEYRALFDFVLVLLGCELSLEDVLRCTEYGNPERFRVAKTRTWSPLFLWALDRRHPSFGGEVPVVIWRSFSIRPWCSRRSVKPCSADDFPLLPAVPISQTNGPRKNKGDSVLKLVFCDRLLIVIVLTWCVAGTLKSGVGQVSALVLDVIRHLRMSPVGLMDWVQKFGNVP